MFTFGRPLFLKYGFFSGKMLYSPRHILKIVLILTKSLHHLYCAISERVGFYREGRLITLNYVFLMVTLQEIVIHFSFEMMRTFASFSRHTLSVEVLTNSYVKLLKNIFYERRKFTVVCFAMEIISTWSNFEWLPYISQENRKNVLQGILSTNNGLLDFVLKILFCFWSCEKMWTYCFWWKAGNSRLETLPRMISLEFCWD